MKRSILLLMLDVMVLSVLSLNTGGGSSGFTVPVYQWSNLIQQGVQREKDFLTTIATLKVQADEAARKAQQAEDLAARHKQLQDTTIKQLDKLSERESDLFKQQEEIRKKADAATLKAKLAEQKLKETNKALQEAAKQKQEALTKAFEAERLAQEADTKIKLAQQREMNIQKRIAEMESKEGSLLQQGELTEQDLIEQKKELARKSGELDAAMEAKQAALDREKQAWAQLNAERQRAEKIMADFKVAQSKADVAEKKAETSQKFISVMRDRMTELKLTEQEAQLKRQKVEEENQRITQKLEAIIEEQNQSIWVQRDQAMAGCTVTLVERDPTTEVSQTYQETIYSPVVTIDNQRFIITEFEHLGLAWWQVQYNNDLISVNYAVYNIYTNDQKEVVRQPILANEEAPSVCMLRVKRDLNIKGLKVAGMNLIKKERIQEALAFSPIDPDKSLNVNITPMLHENLLSVKTLKTKGWFQRRELRKGDYLLTETGYFIGIMIAPEVCWVIPSNMQTQKDYFQIPIARSVTGLGYGDFHQQAQKLKRKIKRNPLPSR